MIIGISGKIGSGKDTVAKMIQYLSLKKEFYKFDKQNESLLYAFYNDSVDYFQHSKGWEIKRFADKLKDIACMLIGCTREQLEDREFKEKPLGEEWHVWWTQYKNRKYKNIFSSEKEFNQYMSMLREDHFQIFEDTAFGDYRLTPRKLMQLIGTEAGREIIHPNIWVNALFSDYVRGNQGYDEAQLPVEKYPNWIIPDVRFENEAKAIKDRGGVLIRIERKPWLRFGVERGETRVKSKKELHPSETSLDDYEDWDYVIYNNWSMEKLFEIVQQIYEEIT